MILVIVDAIVVISRPALGPLNSLPWLIYTFRKWCNPNEQAGLTEPASMSHGGFGTE